MVAGAAIQTPKTRLGGLAFFVETFCQISVLLSVTRGPAKVFFSPEVTFTKGTIGLEFFPLPTFF